MISQRVGLCCKWFYNCNIRRLKEFEQLNKFNNNHDGGLFHVLKDNDRIYIRALNG